MPVSAPQVMPTPGKVAPVVAKLSQPSSPAPRPQRNEIPESLAPMPKPVALSPPALPVVTGLAPRPYRNLLYFSDLEAVLAAIAQAKARATDQGQGFARRFAWVRARYEPEIAIPSLVPLAEALFGKNNTKFDAEALLDEAIAQLPAETAAKATAHRAETLQLEGLWIEFLPQSADGAAMPHLAIAVSIALASPEPPESMVEPLVANRVYLTCGAFQP